MMDPEPGRCRRTDGKKWRCSRNVLSQQKYCERHIHRGRQRSRKLVEAPEFASPSATTTTTTTIVRPKAESSLNSNPDLSVSVGLQLMTPSSAAVPTADPIACGKRDCYAAPPFIMNNTSNTASDLASNSRVLAATTPVPTSSHYSSAIGNTSEKKTGQGSLIRGCSVSSNFYSRSIVARSHISQGLGFSLKSVLQVAGHDNLFAENRSHVAFEPGRCRRTDGKKWQCRREVVPLQKYCPRHMHRGAKRLAQAYVVPATALSGASNATLLPRPPPMEDKRHPPIPNTNLCISTPTSPPPNEESSTSSDTTITDTSS